MNLRDIFKAKNSIRVKTKIQKMDKKQLEKVIGGIDSTDCMREGGRSVGAGQVTEIIK